LDDSFAALVRGPVTRYPRGFPFLFPLWLAIVFGPILYFGAAIWLSTHGLVLLAEEMIGLVVAAAIAGGLVALARRAAFPRFAEFDGQVIRQWVIEGDDDTPTRHCVAVDAGTGSRAWALTVTAAQYPVLTPGTFVHVQVNPRRNRPLSVQPTEPPPVASRLAAFLADQD